MAGALLAGIKRYFAKNPPVARARTLAEASPSMRKVSTRAADTSARPVALPSAPAAAPAKAAKTAAPRQARHAGTRRLRGQEAETAEHHPSLPEAADRASAARGGTGLGSVGGICGVLLAAGSGSRFGGGKLAHPLPGSGVPLAIAAWRQLRAAVPQACVVVRAGDAAVLALFRAEGARIIECDDAASGMGRSLSCGVRANAYASGWLIALGDMPSLRSETIRTHRGRARRERPHRHSDVRGQSRSPGRVSRTSCTRARRPSGRRRCAFGHPGQRRRRDRAGRRRSGHPRGRRYPRGSRARSGR